VHNKLDPWRMEQRLSDFKNGDDGAFPVVMLGHEDKGRLLVSHELIIGEGKVRGRKISKKGIGRCFFPPVGRGRRGSGIGEDATKRRRKRGGWYGALTSCGSQPAAARGCGGGSARSSRDRGGSETLIGGAPTIVTGGDGFI
jgi:hypothetical protein